MSLKNHFIGEGFDLSINHSGDKLVILTKPTSLIVDKTNTKKGNAAYCLAIC